EIGAGLPSSPPHPVAGEALRASRMEEEALASRGVAGLAGGRLPFVVRRGLRRGDPSFAQLERQVHLRGELRQFRPSIEKWTKRAPHLGIGGRSAQAADHLDLDVFVLYLEERRQQLSRRRRAGGPPTQRRDRFHVQVEGKMTIPRDVP